MARIRYIKPGFFASDELAEVSTLGRLLFIGMWCWADKEGRLHDRPRRLKAEILPFDRVDVDRLLNNLAERGFLTRYVVSGSAYIQVVNFKKHQRPHPKEEPSIIPPPLNHEPSIPQAHPKEEPSMDEVRVELDTQGRGTGRGGGTPTPLNRNEGGEQEEL